jgi:hypothetical protein
MKTPSARRLQKLVFVTIAALVIAGTASSLGATGGELVKLGRPTTLGPPDPKLLGSLRSLVGHVALVYGESHPTGGQVVASTRRAANLVANGAEITTNPDVYVVEVRGHFTAQRAAFGVRPQGSVLTLVVDPTTLSVLDLTISKAAPDLRQLGTPQPLGTS